MSEPDPIIAQLDTKPDTQYISTGVEELDALIKGFARGSCGKMVIRGYKDMTSQAVKLQGGHMTSITNKEVWKPLPGFEEIILVSNTGRVASIRQLYNKHTSGYVVFRVKKDKKVLYNWLVHRAIATAFIPNPDKKPFVNHKNGVKKDNRVENLEWATPSENTRHAFATGLQVSLKGEDHGYSKLTEKQVIEIRMSSLSQSQAALKYGVSAGAIQRVRQRLSWKHI